MVNGKIPVTFEEENPRAVKAHDIVMGLDGGVAEIDPLALVVLDQVVTKNKGGLPEPTAIDIVVDGAIFDNAAGKVSMQRVRRITDITVAQVHLLGEINPDLQPVTGLWARLGTAKANRFGARPHGHQAALDSQNSVSEAVGIGIPAHKTDVSTGGNRQGHPLGHLDRPVNPDATGPDRILADVAIPVNGDVPVDNGRGAPPEHGKEHQSDQQGSVSQKC